MPANHDPAAPGALLLRRWEAFSRFPLGATVFSRLIGRQVPYSGTLRARVATLEPGHAVLTMRVRRRTRNHLGSVHAVALTNLGELTSGLALLTGLPAGVRGIVLRLESEYLKKGRGTLMAIARWAPPEDAFPLPDEPETSLECWAEATIGDEEGDEVARVRALWRLGPRR